MRRAVFICALAVLATGPLIAEDIIGEIVYLEGYPEIIRDGDFLFESLDFGFPIQNFDAIETDSASLAEVEIDPETGIDATILVRPETQFTVQMTALRAEQEGVIELLAGSLGVVVRELIGATRLALRTHSSVVGVRGTIFDVTTSADGSVLVTTDEGTVEVTSEFSAAVFASPGEAVEINAERFLVRNLRYEDATADFTRRWIEDRLDALQANPARFVRFYGVRYLAARSEFDRAYRELMSQREIIDTWIEESRRGASADTDTVQAEKAAIGPPLARTTRSLFAFENSLLRLRRMRPYVDAVLSSMELPDFGTAARMYAVIERDAAVVRRRIATVRYVQKLFALRNNGELPEYIEDTSGSGGEATAEDAADTAAPDEEPGLE